MCFMGSLAGLTGLKWVQTNLQLLIRDPLISEYKLSDMLPSSIVNITLHIDYSSDASYYRDSISDIVSHPRHFHRLESIEVVGVANVRAAGKRSL